MVNAWVYHDVVPGSFETKCTEAMLTCAVLNRILEPEFVPNFTTFTLPSST